LLQTTDYVVSLQNPCSTYLRHNTLVPILSDPPAQTVRPRLGVQGSLDKIGNKHKFTVLHSEGFQ